MSHWLSRHLTFGRRKQEGFKKAFTLVELLLTVAILGTLSAIAIPTYTNYIQRNNNTQAAVDIRNIESQIEGFKALSGRPPNDFAEANIAAKNDPWGNPYRYLRIQGVDWKDVKNLVRRDKHENPVNSDYDLYSIGKDGKTDRKFWQTDAYDDVVRCNGGAYVGLASAY
jgi:general secretion pathway protein G